MRQDWVYAEQQQQQQWFSVGMSRGRCRGAGHFQKNRAAFVNQEGKAWVLVTSGATPSSGQTARGVTEQQGARKGAGRENVDVVPLGGNPGSSPLGWSDTSCRAGTGHLPDGCVWVSGAFCIVAIALVGTDLECQSSAVYLCNTKLLTLVGFFCAA